jgi:hypothetical protein
MQEQIRLLKDRLERWHCKLRRLESGDFYFGTVKPGSSLPDWRDATIEEIQELKADIAAVELTLRALEGLNSASVSE